MLVKYLYELFKFFYYRHVYIFIMYDSWFIFAMQVVYVHEIMKVLMVDNIFIEKVLVLFLRIL